MRESIGGEVTTIHGQDLVQTRVGIHNGEGHRVNVGKGLVAILGEYVARPSIDVAITEAELEHLIGFFH